MFFFFFFQAEDGIRDRNVTGVQTCALPISEATGPGAVRWRMRSWRRKLPIESAGLASARALRAGGMRTAPHSAARMSSTKTVKLLDLPLRVGDRNSAHRESGGC